MKRRDAMHALAAGALVVAGPELWAQDNFPSKPIKFIAPYPAGGTTDLIARTIGDHFQKTWGQPVIIDNRPGNSGMIGAAVAAQSPADGYTLLLGSQALYSVNPFLFEKIPYDPVKHFTPVSLVARMPSFFVVPASLPVNTLREFIQYVKDRPGQIAYGSAGSGTAQHIFFEMFKLETKLDILHVPYKGSVPAVTDLIGGRVQAMMDFGTTVLPFVRSGKLKALAVSTKERSAATPNVPTMEEAGITDFNNSTWFAIHGPAGLPLATLNKLSDETRNALGDPNVRARFISNGIEAFGSTSEDLLVRQKADAVRYADVIKHANIKVD